ncbi:hypothetical protein J6590_096355 [Homalodisca vitripennis]|nr:hypothetical protein J6590_096355 [Homalodisca vitripennis]
MLEPRKHYGILKTPVKEYFPENRTQRWNRKTSIYGGVKCLLRAGARAHISSKDHRTTPPSASVQCDRQGVHGIK